MANPNPNKDLDKMVYDLKEDKGMTFEKIAEFIGRSRSRAYQRYLRHKKLQEGVDN